MHELTRKNHFRFGYDGKAFNSRTSEDDRWTVSYGRCADTPLPFGQECVRTARQIRDATRLPIWVLFSGGIDSEVVMESFRVAGVPVHTAILRFKNDLNEHDIRYAVRYCEARNVPYRFFDLDLMEFFETSAIEYAERAHCITPRMLPTMWLMDQIDGFPVLGSGECHIVQGANGWSLSEKEKIASWYRHLIERDRPGVPGFFQYTPELMLSFCLEPRVTDLVLNRIPGKLSTVSSKHLIYSRYFELEDRTKYMGFEKVENDAGFIRLQDELRKRLSAYDQNVLTPFTHLLDTLQGSREREKSI